MSTPGRVFLLWEAVQVELRGRCSLTRFHAILDHAKETSRWQHIGIMLLTPLPVLLAIVLLDILPLYPPEDGIFRQSLGFYLRNFGEAWVMAHMTLMQMHASSPALPLSTARHWVISVSCGLAGLMSTLALGWFVVFPTPFSNHAAVLPWIVIYASGVWAAWKDAFAVNPDAKRKVLHYAIIVFNAQPAMFFIYSCYTVAFNKMPSAYQAWFTFLLPAIKLGFKNWMIKGIYYVEDLAPAVIVFNVDVFHAIYVSSTMQGSSSWGSVIVVMAIDVVQAATAYYEVSKTFRNANELAKKSHTDPSALDPDTNVRRTQSYNKRKLGVIDYALDVVDANPRLRSHPGVALPRYQRELQVRSTRVAPVTLVPSAHCTSAVGSPPPTGQHAMPLSATQQPQDSEICPVQLDEAENADLECVKSVLKMLHMIEFYVLIEFVEAIVPTINAVCMHVLVYLPNRVYYWTLADLTQDEVRAKADRTTIYALLELLSFVVFCYLMDRRLRHTSTYQLLAFVLHKNMRIAQSALSMWIFMIVQIGIRHSGEFS